MPKSFKMQIAMNIEVEYTVNGTELGIVKKVKNAEIDGPAFKPCDSCRGNPSSIYTLDPLELSVYGYLWDSYRIYSILSYIRLEDYTTFNEDLKLPSASIFKEAL